ncbi:MAG: hypothetical protein JWR24_4695 [Actinoallomurus sp.]|nr:hypothetical protein [Actinoallomurus sp.]
MEMRVRRAWSSAALAAVFLLLPGWRAIPARAVSVDPDLVAESVTEDGYYVDSNASCLRSDSDLDKLRAALRQAGRAGVVVLPAGTAAGPVLHKLLQSPNRDATYVVLSGTTLRAASTSLSMSAVNKLVARATKTGAPESQVLTFLDLMNPGHSRKSGGARKGGDLPPAQPSSDARPGTVNSAPVAARKNDSGGGNGLLYGVGGGIVVAALAAVSGVLWRRKRAASTPDGSAPGIE